MSEDEAEEFVDNLKKAAKSLGIYSFPLPPIPRYGFGKASSHSNSDSRNVAQDLLSKLPRLPGLSAQKPLAPRIPQKEQNSEQEKPLAEERESPSEGVGNRADVGYTATHVPASTTLEITKVKPKKLGK